MDYISATPRNRPLGLLADVLQAAKANTGLLGDVVLGEAPRVLDQWSYGFSPIRAGRTDQGLMGAVYGATVDPGLIDVAGLAGLAPVAAKGAKMAGREALSQVNDAMLGSGNKLIENALSPVRPLAVTPNTSVMPTADELIREIVEAAQAAPRGARIGLRMMPEDVPLPPVGSILTPSFRWIDGVQTDKPLFGTSSIGLERVGPDSVREALIRLGQIDRSPFRGYYPGQSIGLLAGPSKRKGEDVGEWMIRDARLLGLFDTLIR